jgi:hypothetical protein
LGISDRGCCIDSFDYVVVAGFSSGAVRTLLIGAGLAGVLHVSLYHFAAAGLCLAHGRNRAVCCSGDRNVRDAKSGLVRARRRVDVNRAIFRSGEIRILDLSGDVERSLLL